MKLREFALRLGQLPRIVRPLDEWCVHSKAMVSVVRKAAFFGGRTSQRQAEFWLLLAVLVSAGCAQGGEPSGDDDEKDRDATIRIDATAANDSGQDEEDSGRDDPADAGLGEDAGEENDAGGDDSDSGASDDAGFEDAGSPDATACPMACDDGLACNGVETCVGGRCLAGAAIDCGDGIACTTDSCIEPTGTCSNAPDDTRCASGESCVVGTGCERTSTCAQSPCDLQSPQCGCATGEGCYLDDTTGLRECVAAGTGDNGDSCTEQADCAPGYFCADSSVSILYGIGICKEFCTTDSDCHAGDGAVCAPTVTEGDGTLTSFCTANCNPVTQAGCASSTQCQIFARTTTTTTYLTDCQGPVGFGTQGSLCGDDTDCARGYVCLDPDSTGPERSQCLHWCNARTGNGCSFLYSCASFVSPIEIGSIEYGVCI